MSAPASSKAFTTFTFPLFAAICKAEPLDVNRFT